MRMLSGYDYAAIFDEPRRSRSIHIFWDISRIIACFGLRHWHRSFTAAAAIAIFGWAQQIYRIRRY